MQYTLTKVSDDALERAVACLQQRPDAARMWDYVLTPGEKGILLMMARIDPVLELKRWAKLHPKYKQMIASQMRRCVQLGGTLRGAEL